MPEACLRRAMVHRLLSLMHRHSQALDQFAARAFALTVQSSQCLPHASPA